MTVECLMNPFSYFQLRGLYFLLQHLFHSILQKYIHNVCDDLVQTSHGCSWKVISWVTNHNVKKLFIIFLKLLLLSLQYT
uniref:Uncharacterized protein n=1 Tax=Cyclopterus lumpus TaxID=8103 RepID=A0A8C2ZEM3_CYCLU